MSGVRAAATGFAKDGVTYSVGDYVLLHPEVRCATQSV